MPETVGLPITLPIDRFWDGVYFITPDTGIIVGRSSAEGRAYITFNGGANWQAGYVTDFPLYGVTGLPHANGYRMDLWVWVEYRNPFPMYHVADHI